MPISRQNLNLSPLKNPRFRVVFHCGHLPIIAVICLNEYNLGTIFHTANSKILSDLPNILNQENKSRLDSHFLNYH